MWSLHSRVTPRLARLAPRLAPKIVDARRLRHASSRSASQARGATERDNASLAAAALATAIGAVGLSYAAVPLYRLFCQATGYGGTVKTHSSLGADDDDGYNLPADPRSLPNNRLLKISFNTDVATDLPWTFKPAQKTVSVYAGETALAFFETTNNSSAPIIGVATYNVTPMAAGQYFNKIQCFCFDEQRLLPGETVDMPVFFYVDPDFLDDRRMRNVNSMTLSYTFFRAHGEEDADERMALDKKADAEAREAAAARRQKPVAVTPVRVEPLVREPSVTSS